MSFRELSMIEIREVLRRWSAGQAVRAVARETGVDRKTVDRYVSVAREVGAIVARSQPTKSSPLLANAFKGDRCRRRRISGARWRDFDPASSTG